MKTNKYNGDHQKIDMVDIIQLHKWIDLFLFQRGIKKNQHFVQHSNLSSWKNELQNISRMQLTVGFVNFSKLVDVVLKNNLAMIPISPAIFKMLCYQTNNEKVELVKSKTLINGEVNHD